MGQSVYSVHKQDKLYKQYAQLTNLLQHDEVVYEDALAMFLIENVTIGSISDTLIQPKIYVKVDAVLLGYQQQNDKEMQSVIAQQDGFVYDAADRPATSTFIYTLNRAEMIQAFEGGLYDNVQAFKMDMCETLKGHQFVETISLVEDTYSVTTPITDDLRVRQGYETTIVTFVGEMFETKHLEYEYDKDNMYQSLQSVMQYGLYTLVDLSAERDRELVATQLHDTYTQKSLYGRDVQQQPIAITPPVFLSKELLEKEDTKEKVVQSKLVEQVRQIDGRNVLPMSEIYQEEDVFETEPVVELIQTVQSVTPSDYVLAQDDVPIVPIEPVDDGPEF